VTGDYGADTVILLTGLAKTKLLKRHSGQHLASNHFLKKQKTDWI